MTGSRYSFRCGVCSINWPYTTNYIRCPICEEQCRGLHLNTPGLDADDEILTPEAATQLLRDRGKPTWGNQPAPSAVAVKRVPTEEELKRLDEALDRWHKEPPPWVK